MNSTVAVLWKSVSLGIPRILKGETVATAGIQAVITRVLVIVLNVATGILTARLLGAEGRGEQAAMILWQGFLAGLFSLGLPSSLVFNLKSEPAAASRLFGAALLMSSLLGCAAAAVGVIFIPVWLAQYSPEVIRYAQFFMINTPVAALMLICRAALESRGDYSASNKTLLLTPLFTLIGLVLLIPAHAFTPFNTALVYTFASLPIAIWTLRIVWKDYAPSLLEFGGAARTLLHYGFRSYGSDLLGTLADQIDKVLVVGFLSPSAMGMYTVSLNLSRMLYVFQGSIVMILFPRIAAQPTEKVVEMTGQAARISVAVTVLAGVGMMLLGPFILQTLYGDEFKDATALLNVLIVEAGLGGTIWILTTGFMALGRPGTVMILQMVGLALSIPLLLLLIPIFGMFGASLALLGSAIIRLIFVQLCFPLLLKTPAPSLLIKREDFRRLRQSLAR